MTLRVDGDGVDGDDCVACRQSRPTKRPNWCHCCCCRPRRRCRLFWRPRGTGLSETLGAGEKGGGTVEHFKGNCGGMLYQML